MAFGDVLQSQAGSGSVAWAITPTAGSLLLLWKAGRDGAGLGAAAPTGWTHLGSNGAVGLSQDGLDVYGKISDGTETGAAPLGGFTQHWWVATFDGLSLAGFLEGEGSASSSAILTGSVTPSAGAPVAILGASTFLSDDATNTGFVPGTGWTEIFDTNNGNSHPWLGIVRKVVSSPSGSYNPAMTPVNNVGAPVSSLWYGITLALTGGTPTAVGYDVHEIIPPGDSINFVDTLDDAYDRSIRPVRNQTGTGQFKINRSSPNATAAILKPGNLVKVRYPEIDPSYIFAWFMENGNFELVSTDEQGGEEIHISGRGALSYWDRAVWLSSKFTIPWWPTTMATPPAGTRGAVQVVAGTYRQYTIATGASATLAVSAAADDIIDTAAAHGFVVGQRVRFTSLTGGAGLVTGTRYHVIAANLGSTTLQVSATAGGAAVNFTTNITAGALLGDPTITGFADFTTAAGFSAYFDTRQTYQWPSANSKRFLVHLTTTEDPAAPSYVGYYFHPKQDGVTEILPSYATGTTTTVLLSDISPDKPGAILYHLFMEGTDPARPTQPIPLMTIDFTATLDSNGVAWSTTDALEGLTAELGETYLDTIAKLVSTGVIDVEMGPDLDMHAYNALGRDLTSTTFAAGKVRFAKGTNIADKLARERDNNPVATFRETVGLDGVVSQVALPDAATRVARESAGTGDSSVEATLDAIGLAALNARLVSSDAIGFRIATGNVDATGRYLPGPEGTTNGDFWLGDLVTLHTGTGEQDFTNATERVYAITISEDEGGNLEALPEVGSVLGEAERRLYASSGSSSSFTSRSQYSDTEVAEPSTGVDVHIADTIDAHDASAVSFVPAAGIAATDVQAAILEDAGDLAAHLVDTVDAHDASAISFAPNGTIAATDVQAAIQEVRDEASGSGIPATIVDVKGDLIVATAADTVARLAAAANGAAIITASGEATGLKWRLNNDGAAAAPTVNEDSGDGYAIGSRWLDTTNDKEYVALDVTAAAAVWVETTGAGGSGVSWTADVNESGTSFASFTGIVGTWASDGTTINQTDTSATFKSAKYNTKIPVGFPTIFEAEIRFPTTGQGAGGFIYGGLLIGTGLAVILDRANNLIRFQDWSVADRKTSAFTIALDTYYKLRVVSNGIRTSAYVDGVLIGSSHIHLTQYDGDFLYLGSYGSLVNFRNIKAWTLSGSAPA